MNDQRKFLILTASTVCSISSIASVVREDTPYQYYRDFAENRGIFTPGATNVKIKLKDGKEEVINVPIPDLSSAASTADFPGIANLIEGQFTTTCAHNPGFYADRLDPKTGKDTGGGINYLANMTFGKGSTYQYKMVSEHDHPNFKTVDNRIEGQHIDFAVPRLNKLVTEVAPPKRFNNFPEEYKKNPNRFTALARVGSGRQHIKKDGDMVQIAPGQYQLKMIPENQLQTAYEYLTGGMSPMKDMMIENVNDQILIKENNEFRKNAPLGSTTTNGDSGSPIYVYDNVDKEWKWLGNVLGAYTGGYWKGQDLTQYDIYSEPHGYVDEIIKKYTVNIPTTQASQTYHWGKSGAYNYTLNTTTFGGKGDDSSFRSDEKIRALDNGKNIVLNGGGTIILDQDVDQGAGTITFKDSYTLKGKDNNISWIGGGLDIAKDKNVNWQVKGIKGDSLHKIGEGTLTVNGNGNNEGDISIGDGTLVLNQQGGKAFNNIEIVSGRPTVKMIGKDQVSSSDNIIFGFRGGKLDLNGQDLEFKGGVKAFDIGANISNDNNKQASNIIISEKKSGNNDWSFSTSSKPPRATSGNMVYHGKITNNVNTTVKGDSGKMLFDGEINTPNNKLSIEKETILQGHPVIHAYTTGKSFANNRWESTTIAEKLKNNFNDTSLLTKPVSANQTDWENRNFNLNEIELKSNKALTIGRNANVKVKKLNSNSSIVNLGTKKVMIDENDGDGLSQTLKELESTSITSNDRAKFTGDIIGSGSTINMTSAIVNASVNDSNGTININDSTDWTLLKDTTIKNLNATNKNSKIDLSAHEGDKWNKTVLTTDNLNSKDQTYELTVYPKAGDGDKIVVNTSAKGSGNKLKLDFINPSADGKDIRDKILLATTPSKSTENGLNYFEATSEQEGFSIYKPNIEKKENNGKYEWYLKKNDDKAKEVPKPLETPPEAKPGGGGSTTPPSEKPGEGGSTTSPSEKPGDGGSTTSPSEKPGEGGSTTPPSEKPGGGGSITSPSEKPGEGGSTTSPSEKPGKGGSTTSPSEKPGEGGSPDISVPAPARIPAPSDNPYMISTDNLNYIRDVKALLNTQEAIFINENELLTKRLGDIRASDKEAGIWYKVQAHQNDLDGVKLKGKTLEVGADVRKNNSIYGLFGSYSEGKTSIKDGYNDFKYGGVGAYYTYTTENGGFIDLVGKYIKTSQRIKLPKAHFEDITTEVFNKTPRQSTDMFMGSAQTGFRKTSKNGFFIEPSIKLTAGHMDGYKVKGNNGATAEVKSSNPIYGEAGIQVGKNFNKKGKRKFSVSTGVHYQQRIGDKGKIILTDKEKIRTYDTMDTDKVVANVSVSGSVTNNLDVYGRIEKSFGGKYKTDYSAQVGFRYKF